MTGTTLETTVGEGNSSAVKSTFYTCQQTTPCIECAKNIAVGERAYMHSHGPLHQECVSEYVRAMED